MNNKKEFDNLKIGEKFNFGYREFIVKSFWSCKDCAFNSFNIDNISCEQLKKIGAIPKCQEFEREDETNVCFDLI